MPESAVTDTAVGHEVASVAREDVSAVREDAPVSGGEARVRTNWFYYCLGLALQTFLWLLLFLGIIVAVVVGTHLTEFRYVGF